MPKGITKRKDGLYSIRKTINGKRITKYSKTLNDAKKIYTELKNNKLLTSNKNLSVKEWTIQWLETYKKPLLKTKSYHDIALICNKILDKFGETNINKLTTFEIQRWLNELPHNRTKERITTYFNAILQKAEDVSIISKSPFKAVIREKKNKYKNYALTFAEQEKLIEALTNSDVKVEILIYLLTGCRPNEFPTVKNFDLANNIIKITGTKNENAKLRKVKISDNFSTYLKSILPTYKFKTVKEIRKEFKKICKAQKINATKLYVLRHTFASNYFAIGIPTKYVQQWLGHSSIVLTMDIYTDTDENSTKNKIQKLYNNYYLENI